MKSEIRLIVTYVVRLALLFFAVWLALWPDALPGAHVVVRAGLIAQFMVVSILVGEMAKLQTKFDMFIRALRSAGVKVSGDVAPRQGHEALAILIRALGSKEATTRDKAHRNLVRLTGQDLPPDRAAWERWLKSGAEEAEKSAESAPADGSNGV